MSITTKDRTYRICACGYKNVHNCYNHCSDSIRIDNIDWKEVIRIGSSHGGFIDKIINKNIVDFVKHTTQLIYLETNPSDIFKYCTVDDRFISINSVRTIPTVITNNKYITQYKFLRGNVFSHSSIEIFNFLPEHLEMLEIYYDTSEFIFNFFLNTNLNLPINIKKLILDFRANHNSEYLNDDIKNNLLNDMHNKIKVPFGCELIINIQHE